MLFLFNFTNKKNITKIFLLISLLFYKILSPFPLFFFILLFHFYYIALFEIYFGFILELYFSILLFFYIIRFMSFFALFCSITSSFSLSFWNALFCNFLKTCSLFCYFWFLTWRIPFPFIPIVFFTFLFFSFYYFYLFFYLFLSNFLNYKI